MNRKIDQPGSQFQSRETANDSTTVIQPVIDEDRLAKRDELLFKKEGQRVMLKRRVGSSATAISISTRRL
jgi:hypothetical protein